MRRCMLVVIAVLAGREACAQAERLSSEDACRPDVLRLCASDIPDEANIVACLNARAASLSPACRAVIAPETIGTRRRAVRR